MLSKGDGAHRPHGADAYLRVDGRVYGTVKMIYDFYEMYTEIICGERRKDTVHNIFWFS